MLGTVQSSQETSFRSIVERREHARNHKATAEKLLRGDVTEQDDDAAALLPEAL